jgi:hypothetical protein
MTYIWIAIAILLIILVSTNTIKTEKFASMCSRSCPVHSTHFDPPYPHSFHFVSMTTGRNRVYECTKCRCQTLDPGSYPISVNLS